VWRPRQADLLDSVSASVLQTAAVDIVVKRFTFVLSSILVLSQRLWVLNCWFFRKLLTDNLLAKKQLHAESNLSVQAATGWFSRALLFVGFPPAQQHAAPQSLVTHSQHAGAKASPTIKQPAASRKPPATAAITHLARFPQPQSWRREGRLQKRALQK
jgi:hypothetical protein